MQKPLWYDLDDDEGVLREMTDPLVPQALREHGARFRNPAAYALDLGDGAYFLYGKDGELLDMLTYGG